MPSSRTNRSQLFVLPVCGKVLHELDPAGLWAQNRHCGGTTSSSGEPKEARPHLGFITQPRRRFKGDLLQSPGFERRKDGALGLLLAGGRRGCRGTASTNSTHKGRRIRRGEEARARPKLEGIVGTR